MNFDELKKQWNNEDDGSSAQISENMLKIKEAHTPVDKIRKQMKHEFYVQLLSLVVMAFLPKMFNFSTELKMVFYIFYAITCGFTAYYFFKFYTFYKHSYDLSLDSRKNLLWFYYEMRMNIELYKALTYIIGFIALAFACIYLLVSKNMALAKLISELSMLYLVLNCFISILLLGFIADLWSRFYYGKYLNQIKKILDSLDME